MSTELNLEAERALFEYEYCQKYPTTVHIRPEKFSRDENGDYLEGAVFVAWDMWQIARRASPAAAVPVNAVDAPTDAEEHLANVLHTLHITIDWERLNKTQVIARLREVKKALAAGTARQGGDGESKAAEIGPVDALPPLPKPDLTHDDGWGSIDAWSEAAVRDAQRAAVEADRAQQHINRLEWGSVHHALKEAQATLESGGARYSWLDAYVTLAEDRSKDVPALADRAQQGEPVDEPPFAVPKPNHSAKDFEGWAGVYADHEVANIVRKAREYQRKVDEKIIARQDAELCRLRAATKAAAPDDAPIETLARQLAEHYPRQISGLHVDDQPVGRALVEACRTAPVPDTSIPAGEQDKTG